MRKFKVDKVEVEVLDGMFRLFFVVFACLSVIAIVGEVWVLCNVGWRTVVGCVGILMMSLFPFSICAEFALYLYSHLYYKNKRFVFCGETVMYGPDDNNGYLSFERSQVKEIEVFESASGIGVRSYCRVTLQDDGWFVFDACKLDDILPYLYHENVSLMRFRVWNRFSILPD